MNIPSEKIIFDDCYEVVEWINKQIRQAEANVNTSLRLTEAHEYVQKYCFPEGWNKNVWHTILDDAIRMRKEKENDK